MKPIKIFIAKLIIGWLLAHFFPSLEHPDALADLLMQLIKIHRLHRFQQLQQKPRGRGEQIMG